MGDRTRMRTVVRAGLLTVLATVAATVADAQWVMVGRKVIGRIHSLTKAQKEKDPGYDVATVILDAEAGKVFDTAVIFIGSKEGAVVTARDDASRTIAFTQGDWAVELKVTELGEKLSQLLIVSGTGPGHEAGASLVVEAVKRICDQLGVTYAVDPP